MGPAITARRCQNADMQVKGLEQEANLLVVFGLDAFSPRGAEGRETGALEFLRFCQLDPDTAGEGPSSS